MQYFLPECAAFWRTAAFDFLLFFPRRVCAARAGSESYIKGEHGGKVGAIVADAQYREALVSQLVMAGLVPAIHVCVSNEFKRRRGSPEQAR
ncbi:MAG: hypothetical protein V4602_00865 [Pseudomonadota bacterium]